MAYNYITINNYFTTTSNTNKSELPCPHSPKKLYGTLAEIFTEFKSNPLDSLTAATITTKPNKVLSFYDQVYKMEKQLKQWETDNSNKRMRYIGFLEETKNGLPHIHLLLYNAYKAPWDRAFGCLGQHNKNKLSFQKVKNVEKYIEYITKDHTCSAKYYTNMGQ